MYIHDREKQRGKKILSKLENIIYHCYSHGY